MAKRELIDRNNLDITTIVTDDFSDNEVLDVVLMEDVKETPVITEQEIVKPYLDKIKAEIEQLRNFRAENYDLEQYCDCFDARIIFRDDVFEILDKYKKESEKT